MTSRPYTVYVRNRPLKTGFLIDTGTFAPNSKRFDELVDAIIGFNHKTWGGRTNPFIFFSGKSLSDDDWKQLEAVDVDCLRIFSPLPKSLLKQLDERLQPWSIEEIKFVPPDSPIHIESYGIVAPPTPDNLRAFRDAKLLLFDFAPECEPLLQRFVHRNFGTYFQWFEHKNGGVRREAWLENLLPKLNVHHCQISDRKSLAAAMTELVGTPPGPGYRAPIKFIALNELSSLHLPEAWPQWEINNVYQVIVGDAPDDFVEHWNGVYWKQTWTNPHVRHLWLPTELARDPLLRDALKNWFRRYTGTGSSGAKAVEFISASLSFAELETLRQEICGPVGIWTPHSHVAKSETLTERRRKSQDENLTRRALVLSNTDHATRYSTNNEQETFSLNKPEILADEINPNGVWMADVQIELVSPHKPTAPEQSWWILPRLNSGGLIFNIFRDAARVNRHGLFSVRVENQSGRFTRRVKPELKISLPSQVNVVPWLIMQPNYRPYFTVDVRYDENRSPHSSIVSVRDSDKGHYLRGLVQVFGDFWTAKNFCERRFWRHLFAKLANHDARKDAMLRQDVVNLINKQSQKNDPNHLAGRILGLVRGQRVRGVALTYSEFKHELDELAKTPPPAQFTYPQGDTIVSHHGIQNLTEEEMRSGLNDLVELNVLRPGGYVRCALCGIKTWYHIDELKQGVRCPGCDHEQSIGVPPEWCYALNSLAEMSVVQGQLAAMQALTALASNHHHSFFFSPSLDLFKAGSTDVWREIDVATVAEGEFVIGEVKGGERGDVTEEDFDKLAETAEVLRAQRAIMFLPHNRISPDILNWLGKIRQRLLPQGIKAQIYALPTF